MALINPQKIFEQAEKNNKGICAINVVNLETMKAVLKVASQEKTPVIIQTSEGAIKYYGAENIVDVAKNLSKKFDVDFALHLDHGSSFEACKECIDAGYTSVMIDASHEAFEENVKRTKQVCSYAHARNVFVEAELGELFGVEEQSDVDLSASMFTNSDEVEKFVKQTGVNSLAISVGTSHGAHKIAYEGGLKIDLIEKIHKENSNVFLVLHGASTINKETISSINALGGKIERAQGNDPNQLKQAIKSGMRKINTDSDIRLAYTYGVRKFLKEHPEVFDIRKIVNAGTAEIEKAVKEKINLISK